MGGSNGHTTSGDACTAQPDRQDKQRQSCDVGWCPGLLIHKADVRCANVPLHDTGGLHPADLVKKYRS